MHVSEPADISGKKETTPSSKFGPTFEMESVISKIVNGLYFPQSTLHYHFIAKRFRFICLEW